MDIKEKLKILGSNFKKIRVSKGLTQTQLAFKIGKDQQSIQRFEKGAINPSYVYLLEIFEGLEIDLSDALISGTIENTGD